MSLERIGKSLRKLEEVGVIETYHKHGKPNLYKTHWSVLPDDTVKDRVYRPTIHSVSPHDTVVYRPAVSIKNNEKEQKKAKPNFSNSRKTESETKTETGWLDERIGDGE